MNNHFVVKYLCLVTIACVFIQLFSPVLQAVAITKEKIPDATTKKEEKQGLELLTVDKKGNILYNNEPLLVGKNNEKIPANLDKLMQAGVPETLILPRGSVGTATIKYKGQLTYSYYTVGDFTVNGKQAFCMEHPKGTPATNQPNNGLEPYNNDSIAAVLYWGWGGAKNIFTDRTLGIVSTSLALSHFYYGDTPGTPPSGYNTLITKGKNKDVPSHLLRINNSNKLVNLTVTFDGKKQKSKTAILNAEGANSITYKVPANITFVNETTGATATNKDVKIKGGQKFHLEAGPNVAKTVTSPKLKGTVKQFQPLIVKPVSSGLQDIGTWRWYDDPAQVVSFKAIFKPRKGDLEITKKSSDGKLLVGAEYDIKTADNKVVKHVKTGTNGKIKTTDLTQGSYNVTETKAPAGYTLDKTVANRTKKVTVTAGQTALMTFTNKQVFVQVKIKKGDAETGDKAQGDATLVGAKYGVYDDAKATKLLDEVTIAKDLSATSKKLPMNGASRTLYVKETKAPTGYNLDKTIYKVEIKQANTTAELFVGNATSKDKVIEGGFDLIKTANKPLLQENTGKGIPLAGAEFSATLKSTGKVVQKQVTDKNGKAVFSKLPYGTYTVSETKVPEGYLPVANFEVTINKEGQTFHYQLEDKVKESKIKLIKKDKETNKTIPLAGTTFKIKNSLGLYIDQNGKTEFETLADGTVLLDEPLVYGDYTVEEIKAPNGYLINKDPIKFTVTGAENTISVSFFDKPAKGKVKGQKLREVIDSKETTKEKISYKKIPAAGITFDIVANKDIVTAEGTVRAKAGDVVDTVMTDKKGYFESTKALYIPDGNEYKLTETNTPENYIPIEPVVFSIDYKNQLTEIVYKTIDVENNLKKGSFEIVKTANKALFSGVINPLLREKPLTLEGAEFTVMSKDRETVQVGVTDNEGHVAFNQLAYGTYFVAETKVPEGYKEVPAFVVTINEDGQHFSYQLEDEVIESTIKIVKKDSETGKIIPRAGATFKIKDSLGNYVEQYTDDDSMLKVSEFMTDEEGTLQLPQMLPYGKYELEEIKAPIGYLLNTQTMPFEVTAETDQQTIELSYFDSPAMGKLKGHKLKEVIDKEKSTATNVSYKEIPAVGITFDIVANKNIVTAEGTVRAKAGDVVDTVTTDKEGYFESTKALYIPEGNEYKLTETNTPENYIPIDPIIFSFSYQDDVTEVVYETINLTNRLEKGRVKVSKIGKEDEKALSGATLMIKGEGVNLQWVSRDEAQEFLLPVGKYTLAETKAPTGYTLNKATQQFAVNVDKVTERTVINEKIPVPSKKEQPKEKLPKSGDSNSLWLPLMGGMLIIAGLGIFIARRKKER